MRRDIDQTLDDINRRIADLKRMSETHGVTEFEKWCVANGVIPLKRK